LKELGLARGRNQCWRVLLRTGPTLMGPALGRNQGWRVQPQHNPSTIEGVAFSVKSYWFWLDSQTQNTFKRYNSVRPAWPARSKPLQKGVGYGCLARSINLRSDSAAIPKGIGLGSTARPKDIGSEFFCSFL